MAPSTSKVSLSVVARSTSKVLLSVVAPSTSKVLLSVVAPSTSKVESNSTSCVACKFPDISNLNPGLVRPTPTRPDVVTTRSSPLDPTWNLSKIIPVPTPTFVNL